MTKTTPQTDLSGIPAFVDFCKVESIKNAIRSQQHGNRKEAAMEGRARRHSQYYKLMAVVGAKLVHEEQREDIRIKISQKQAILQKDIDPEIKIMIKDDIKFLESLLNIPSTEEGGNHD